MPRANVNTPSTGIDEGERWTASARPIASVLTARRCGKPDSKRQTPNAATDGRCKFFLCARAYTPARTCYAESVKTTRKTTTPDSPPTHCYFKTIAYLCTVEICSNYRQRPRRVARVPPAPYLQYLILSNYVKR